jgi:hypothetical protein
LAVIANTYVPIREYLSGEVVQHLRTLRQGLAGAVFTVANMLGYAEVVVMMLWLCREVNVEVGLVDVQGVLIDVKLMTPMQRYSSSFSMPSCSKTQK